MYLGLDIDGKGAAYAFTSDGESIEAGKVTVAALTTLIKQRGVQHIAIEYTGRMAETWIQATGERKALNRFQHERAKTDPRDTVSLARMLYIWHDPDRRPAPSLVAF